MRSHLASKAALPAAKESRMLVSATSHPSPSAGCSGALLRRCAPPRWRSRGGASLGRGAAGCGTALAIGPLGAGRHWRTRPAGCGGALVCAVCRCGALSRGTAPSAAGMRGRGVKPSAAGDTGCGANCAARALMNPFTPTFPRYGAVIEIICYATNK